MALLWCRSRASCTDNVMPAIILQERWIGCSPISNAMPCQQAVECCLHDGGGSRQTCLPRNVGVVAESKPLLCQHGDVLLLAVVCQHLAGGLCRSGASVGIEPHCCEMGRA